MIKGKKIISMVMLLGMMATIFSVNVYAGSGFSTLQTTDYGVEKGSCGKNIRYSLDLSTGELSIYGEGEMYNLEYDHGTSMYYPQVWTEYKNEITSVIINDGVTSIGRWAFKDCTSLTTITIGKSVKEIDNEVFIGCTSLTSIIVDEENPYYQSIDDVLFSKDRTILYKYPEGKAATSYTIPDSVTTIGSRAFKDCTSLTTITIGKGVKEIDNKTFIGCTSLISIIVDEENPYYQSIDDVLFSKDRTILYKYPEGKAATSYTIPDSVTTIGSRAFRGCTSLEEVTIPDSVKEIGEDAFCGCENLTSVTYLGKTNPSHSNAFRWCCHLLRRDHYLSKGECFKNDRYENWEDRNRESNRKRIKKGKKPKPNPYTYSTNRFKYTLIGTIHVPSDYQDDEFCGASLKK